MALLGLDPEFRFKYMNVQAAALFGTTQAGFEGRVLWEAVPSLSGILP